MMVLVKGVRFVIKSFAFKLLYEMLHSLATTYFSHNQASKTQV